MKRLAAIAVALLALAAAAMPTQPELNKAQPLVTELMKPCVAQLRKGAMTPEAVGDKAVEFAAAADTPAAKYLFLKGAVPYYVRAREYDKAADAIESIMSEIPDVPQETLLKLATSATERANAKAAPRLWAIRRRAGKVRRRAQDAHPAVAQEQGRPQARAPLRGADRRHGWLGEGAQGVRGRRRHPRRDGAVRT